MKVLLLNPSKPNLKPIKLIIINGINKMRDIVKIFGTLEYM
jgi:hypothetical protein